MKETTTKVAELKKKPDTDLANYREETARYKKSAEFYETQYNDYKDQMEDVGVVGSTKYYKKKAEELERKLTEQQGSPVENLKEQFDELKTQYYR